jgi:hypothetical protein
MEPTTSNPFRRQHTPLPPPPLLVDHARRSLENEIPESPLSWVNLSGTGAGVGAGASVGDDGAGVMVDAGSLLAGLDDDDGNHWRGSLPLQ